MSQLALLWDAGQERVSDEHRTRQIEAFVGARDGLVAGHVVLGLAKGNATPEYARQVRRPDAAGQRATLARLAAIAPGAIVTRDDS